VTVDDAQPHQLARLGREPVQDWLRDIGHPALAEKAQAHRGELDGQRIVALRTVLPHVPEPGEIVQQPVCGARRHVEPRRDRADRQAAGMPGQHLEYPERPLEHATHCAAADSPSSRFL
jgi:hypothetical protein